MKCKNHADIDALTNCLVCNAPICDECIANNNNAAPQCEKCMSVGNISALGESEANKTEQRMDDQDKLSEAEPEQKKKRKQLIQLGIIVVGFVIMAIQIIRFNSTPEVYPLDKTDLEGMTEVCIYNLLEISDLLQRGQKPGDEYRCAFTDEPYEVSIEDGIIIVRDPNPELHGLREMRVSENELEPVFN